MDSRPRDPRTAARPPLVRLWNAVCLAAIFAAALLVGGCAESVSLATTAAATVSGADTESAPDRAAYLPSESSIVFGRCWATTAKEAESWRTWRGGEFIPCSDEHTLYTYAAEDLPTDLLEAMRASTSDAADTALQVRVDDAVYKICEPRFVDLVPRLTARQVLVKWFSFLPTEAERDAGARWVRCDIGVYEVDTASGSLELTPLPANIHDLVVETWETPQRFQYCRTAPASAVDTGPRRTEGSEPAVCNGEARWVFEGVRPLPYTEGGPYPGADELITAGGEACSNTAQLRGDDLANGWIYYPTEDDWDEGLRTVQCWSTVPVPG